MTPVHCISDVANGEEGDCFRACLATILNVPAESVPNFAQLEVESRERGDDVQFHDLVDNWLHQFGLTTAVALMDSNLEASEVAGLVNNLSPGGPAILSGITKNGGGHSVVIRDGKTFDPSGAGIVGPMKSESGLSEGYWIAWIACGDNFVLSKV